MNDDIIWMSADDDSWGGARKNGLIIVRRDMLSDEDIDTLYDNPTEDEVYAILMKYRDKHARIVFPTDEVI